jgi:hypothetical protein
MEHDNQFIAAAFGGIVVGSEHKRSKSINTNEL